MIAEEKKENETKPKRKKMFQVIYALCSLQLCIHKFQTLILGYTTELNVWHVWQTKLLYISVNAYSHLDLTISFESSWILPSEKLNTSYKLYPSQGCGGSLGARQEYTL